MQIHNVDLEGALNLLSEYLGIPYAKLRGFADADPYPRMGWDRGQGQAPVGSIWSVEGIILYTLVRALEPGIVNELGTSAGASTTHIAAALKSNPSAEYFASVDNSSQLSHGLKAGALVPDALRGEVDLIAGDGLEFFAGVHRVDFVLDDMSHVTEHVEAIWRKAIQALSPGGVIVSHDAAHFIIGQQVRDGIGAACKAANVRDPLVLLIAPGDCGLAIWQKPKDAKPVQAEVAKDEQWPTTEKPSSAGAAKKAAPRRRRSKKVDQ